MVGYVVFDAFPIGFDLAAVPEIPPSWLAMICSMLFLLYLILLLSRRFLLRGDWLDSQTLDLIVSTPQSLGEVRATPKVSRRAANAVRGTSLNSPKSHRISC